MKKRQKLVFALVCLTVIFGLTMPFPASAEVSDYIVVYPDSASITAGASQAYTAEAFDQYNNSLGYVTADTSFSIESGAGGSWSDNVYTSEKAGTWTVTGTYVDESDTATLTVEAPTPPEGKGVIYGMKFNDLNTNAIRDAGEPGVAGVTIKIGDNQTQTDSSGFYSFEVEPGNYIVEEVVPGGSYPTTPAQVVVAVAVGQSRQINFGNSELPDEPDLTIVAVKPVQVVFNADVNNDGRIDLVQGKSTAVLVYVDGSNLETISNEIGIRLSWGASSQFMNFSPQEFKEVIDREPLGKNYIEFYLTSTISGDDEFIAEVDPANVIAESNENNNESTRNVTIRDTQGLNVAYYRVRPIWPANYGQPSPGEYSGTVQNSGGFISATYPIAETEAISADSGDYFGDPIPTIGLFDDLTSIAFWGWVAGANRGVGVVSDAYFPYHGQGINYAGLMSPSITGSALIREGFWTASAHEIGHTYGLSLNIEEYDANPPGNQANGFWVSEREEISNGICFMGLAPPKHSFVRSGRAIWVDYDHYADLFNEFTVTAASKAILEDQSIFVRGLVHEDGTVDLEPIYTAEKVSGYQPLPGEYLIRFVDEQGQVIGDTPFSVSHILYGDTGGLTETSVAGFAFSLPYPIGASKIEIVMGEKVLAERDVSSNSPVVQVVYPNGGQFLKRLETHRITWESTDTDNDNLTYALLYSSDGGASWNPIALDLAQTEYNWDTSELPSGCNYLVKVIASDGFNTSQDISDNSFAISDLTSVGPITAPLDPVQANMGINVEASFTDSGIIDTHMASWDWGDGSTSNGAVSEANGAGNVTGSHTYMAPGVYTVTLSLVGLDNCAFGQSNFQYVVVYDPSAGFVTGGGWINSPSGAYTPDSSLTGKATFGFVSKYKKGAMTPTGVTEFQFKVADLNFHSESYDWLVIAGSKAKYKGIGTINGEGNYGFMLSAIDAGITPQKDDVDTFRIKIWDKDDGDTVVYDNQLGAAEDANPSTAIAGGSIVIHK